MVEARLVCVDDYERAAVGLRPSAADYLNGAAADEHTARWNHRRYAAYRLLPRVCVDVSRLDTGIDLLGTRLDSPIILSPTAGHRLFHADGEAATARGAAAAGALWTISMLSSLPVEELGALATGPVWFQLYVQRDRDFTGELIARATAAGARAIVVTVDTPARPLRDRDVRNGFAVPRAWRPANLRGLPDGTDGTDPGSRYDPWIDPAVTWQTVRWLAETATVPLVVKGVVRPDDARRAVDCGAAAVMVSNHGGRNLDTTVATVDAIAPVAAAVAGDVPVLVDGGIRRGTDVVKALALGATAVGIGRPYVWGLAVGGDEGVRDVFRLLRREFEVAMALSGAPTLADLTPDLVLPP